MAPASSSQPLSSRSSPLSTHPLCLNVGGSWCSTLSSTSLTITILCRWFYCSNYTVDPTPALPSQEQRYISDHLLMCSMHNRHREAQTEHKTPTTSALKKKKPYYVHRIIERRVHRAPVNPLLLLTYCISVYMCYN